MKLKQRQFQRGQAVPIGMALFFFLGLTTYVLFNTGQTVSDKTKIVNTADSAVYSGLLWQSRALNFTAYTNRAMVANQVAMAQAVSLHSWSGYMAKTGSNLDAAFGWVPYVGAVTKIINRVASTIDMFLTPISEGMLTVVNVLNASIGAAQEGMYLATFAATPDVVNSVVKSNDSNNQDLKWETAFSLASAGLNAMEWAKLTDKFDKDDRNDRDAMRERKAIIEASTDKFTNERNWKFFNFFIPITPLNWVRFEKHGTTELYEKNGEYQWHAKDAFSLREKRYTWRGKKYSDLPIAGASSFANSTGSRSSLVGRKTFFGGRHKYAQRRNNIVHDPRGGMSGYSGIQSYRALTREWREDEDSPTMKLRIEIALDPEKIVNSKKLTGDTSEFTTNVAAPGDVITSVSTAELFFEKPCFNASCKEEFANSYSPYWDVRLVKTTGSERLMAYAMHGSTLTDTLHIPKTKNGSLPAFSGSTATPITDYKEQAKGVKTVIRGMENYLETLVVDSPEYQQYAAKLQGIKDSVSFDADAIADDFIQNNLQEEDVIMAITNAAGYDLDVGEYNHLKDQVQSVYGDINTLRDNLTREQLESRFNNMVTAKADVLVAEMEARLKEEVSKAVENILKNMASQYLGDLAGNYTDSDVIGNMADNAADSLLNQVDNVVGDSVDDIRIDVNNECSIYNVVSEAENEVIDLQQRLEAINQKVAEDFHVELELATAEAVTDRNEYNAQISALRQEIIDRPPHMNEEDDEAYVRARREQIDRLLVLNSGVPEKRVHELSLKLMEISNRHTAAEFDNYRLEYRFARRAVEDTLGDIQVLEVDENGETVSQNLFFAEAENELASDTDQTRTQAPEGC